MPIRGKFIKFGVNFDRVKISDLKRDKIQI